MPDEKLSVKRLLSDSSGWHRECYIKLRFWCQGWGKIPCSPSRKLYTNVQNIIIKLEVCAVSWENLVLEDSYQLPEAFEWSKPNAQTFLWHCNLDFICHPRWQISFSFSKVKHFKNSGQINIECGTAQDVEANFCLFVYFLQENNYKGGKIVFCICMYTFVCAFSRVSHEPVDWFSWNLQKTNCLLWRDGWASF